MNYKLITKFNDGKSLEEETDYLECDHRFIVTDNYAHDKTEVKEFTVKVINE